MDNGKRQRFIFGLVLVFVFLVIAGVAVAEETETAFFSEVPCYHPTMGWDAAAMLADGHKYLQVRHVNMSTGEILFQGIQASSRYRVDSPPLQIGACGFGIWQYELRLSSPDPTNPEVLLLWSQWYTFKVVEISHMAGPLPPVFIRIITRVGEWRA